MVYMFYVHVLNVFPVMILLKELYMFWAGSQIPTHRRAHFGANNERPDLLPSGRALHVLCLSWF